MTEFIFYVTTKFTWAFHILTHSRFLVRRVFPQSVWHSGDRSMEMNFLHKSQCELYSFHSEKQEEKNTLLIRAPWPPLCPWVPNSVKVFGSDWMETSLEIDKRKWVSEWVSGYRDRTTSTHMTHVARAKKTRKEERKISFLKTRFMTSLSCKRERNNCADHWFRRCWSVCLSCKQPHLQANCPLSHSLWSHYFLILLHSNVHYEFQQLDVITAPTISKSAGSLYF